VGPMQPEQPEQPEQTEGPESAFSSVAQPSSNGYASNAQASTMPIRLPDLVKTNERQVILAALESAPTKAEAARRLGISPRTLRYKMAQLRMAGAA
jgi:DNA-binding NtrC family response regulator